MSSEQWDESLFNFGFLPHCRDCFISWSAVIAMIFCNVSLFFFLLETVRLLLASVPYPLWSLKQGIYFFFFFLFILILFFFFSLLSRNYFLCLKKLTASFINTLLSSCWKHFLLLIIWWNCILFHVITSHVLSLESLIAFSNHSSPSPLSTSISSCCFLHTHIFFFSFMLPAYV